MTTEQIILKLLLFLAPMYFANSSAMLLGGKTPIDLGKNFFDGKPIFGKGKTFRGFFFGIAMGTIAAFSLSLIFPIETMVFGNNDFNFYLFLL